MLTIWQVTKINPNLFVDWRSDRKRPEELYCLRVIQPVCYVVAASSASQMSKRGSSGRLSARGCPVSRVPHTSSSGTYCSTWHETHL